MIRINKSGVHNVGPRSAHIAGLDYAVFTPLEEIESPQLELFSPKEGDPNDYVAIKLKSGKRVTITNSCAANVLGLVKEGDFSYGNVESARKCMEPIAKYLGVTVEEVARQIMERSYEKVSPIINDLAKKYRLEHDQISLVGVGGGATSLIRYVAQKMDVKYSVPENAEVISSIGVALAMVRDVVERVVPNPSPEDIRKIKQEAILKAVESGAEASTVEVHIEIDAQTSKLTAIATGSTEVKTTDLLKECSDQEALELASEDLKQAKDQVTLIGKTQGFFAYQTSVKGKNPVRVLDKKGFIRIQRNDAEAIVTKVGNYRTIVSKMWEDLAVFKADAVLRPDYYICFGSRVMDFNGSSELNNILMLMEIELNMLNGDEDIVIVGAKNQI